MDPQACLKSLVEAFANRGEVSELLDALRDWLRKGGFKPTAEVADGYFADGKSRPHRKVEILDVSDNGYPTIHYLDSGEVMTVPISCLRKVPENA